MKAVKCDICGAYYDRPRCLPTLRIIKDYGYYGDKTLDLCKECQEKLKKFVGREIIDEQFNQE